MDPWFDLDRLFDLLRGGAGLEICLGPGGDCLQDDFVVRVGPHHHQPDIGAQSMDGGDEWQGKPLSMEAQQGQGKLLIGQELGQLENHKFDPGMILEDGDKALQANGLGLKQRHAQAGRGFRPVGHHNFGSTIPCCF